MIVMAKRSSKKNDAAVAGEPPGQRLARFRNLKGLTHVELAEKLGLLQSHISAYELGRVRLNADMMVQLANALGVSLDDLVGFKKNGNNAYKPSLKIAKRMQKIESLSSEEQRALLKTIDNYLKGAAKT